MSLEYPGRAKFARLTASEERAGLYVDPERIGTRNGWVSACVEAGAYPLGHRLVFTGTSESMP